MGAWFLMLEVSLSSSSWGSVAGVLLRWVRASPAAPGSEDLASISGASTQAQIWSKA